MSEQPTVKPQDTDNLESQSEDAVPGVREVSRSLKITIFLAAWLIVLMPFLFWHATWFGRPLSDKAITEYIHDTSKPRHIQHALVQIAERIRKKDPKVMRWYPDLEALAGYPLTEIRTTDAWVMGQDPTQPAFHKTLIGMLNDPSATVRDNAALSLVSFGDTAGRQQIISMLQPATVSARESGLVSMIATEGVPIRQNATILVLQANGKKKEVRAPINGRIRKFIVKPNQVVFEGSDLAILDPGTEQVWEALRALYFVGEAGDLPLIRPYKQFNTGYPDRIRQQAQSTEAAILKRMSDDKLK